VDNRRQQRFFKIVLAIMAVILGGGIVIMPFVGLPAFSSLLGGGETRPDEAISTARKHLKAAKPGTQKYKDALQELATGYMTLASPNPETGELPKNSKKDLQRAAEAFQKLTVLEPDNTDYLEGLASAYGRSNDYAKAAKVYQKLVKIEPEKQDYWYAWAQSADASGDKTTAILAYSKFIKLVPDDPSAEVAADRIKELKKPASANPNIVTSAG
jgi:tetratricopeptide (TPR) repeat protein